MNNLEHMELLHELKKNLSRLERQQRQFVNKSLAIEGFSGNLYRYVVTIHWHPGINQDFLADFHSVDKSRITRVVRQLEDLGYIERRPDEADRRRFLLALTDSGETLYDYVNSILIDWSRLITEDIPTDELRIAVGTIKRMVQKSEKL